MASRETRVGVRDSEERWDRKPPPPIPWNQQVWPPDHERCGDLFWSGLLQMRIEEFRDLVVSLGVPYTKPGRCMFVLSKDLSDALKAR